MLHGETLASEQGIDRLTVDTSVVNAGMQRLFADLGFELKGEIALEGRDGLRFVCYEKLLI